MKTLLTLTLISSLLFVSCSRPPSRASIGKSGSNSGSGDGNGAGGAGGGAIGDGVDGSFALSFTTAFPRLSHVQWDNAVRDALLLPASPDLSKNFTPDPTGSAYGNDASLLKVSAMLWADYRNAAETVAESVSTNKDQLALLLPKTLPANEDEKAKAIVTPIAKRAFRRPPTTDELTKLTAIFKNGPKESDNKDPVAAGVEAVVAVILQSPAFLYRAELGDKTGANEVQLTAYEVASRLSFAIWNTIPDADLFAAAENGSLLKPETLRAQVTRLVNDPKGMSTLAYFHSKAFNIDKFVGLNKDAKLFPNWPKDLGTTLREEASLFLAEVVKTDGTVADIYTAPYTFVNDKTAPLYGVKSPGEKLTKTMLDGNERSGILTQIGFLASKAHENENDPIHRGTYIVGEVLCTQLAAPPVTGEIPPPNDKLKTLRDRVNALTSAPACAACHVTAINPAGFAFEKYDATGVYREMEGSEPVDASGEYTIMGTKDPKLKFEGSKDFIKGLVAKKQTHSCYLQKAAEMFYGQRPGAAEKQIIEGLAEKSAKGLSIRNLVIELMSNPRILLRNNQEVTK